MSYVERAPLNDELMPRRETWGNGPRFTWAADHNCRNINMLPGLAIRQGFLALDLLLAGVIVAVATMVVGEFFEKNGESKTAQPIAAGPDEASEMFYAVKNRASYQPIIDSGIFGKAASAVEPQVVVAKPPQEEETITDLALKLFATTLSGPNDPLATAIIEVNVGRPISGVFYVGQQVVDKVYLADVRPREVVLDNRVTGEREILRMDNKILRFQVAANTRRAPRGRTSPNRITLNRKEFVNDLQINYTDLITKVKPRYVKDANGKVTGITANNISEIPLAKKLNLQDGDILQTINNERIDSEDKIIEVINKYRNASTFRLGIMRNGRSQVLTYHLE